VRGSAAACLFVLAVPVVFLAGCGGTDEGGSAATEPTTTAGRESLETLWRAHGEDVAVVAGTSDHAVGANRISFLVVDKQGRAVERPTARVWISRGLKQAPFAETTARLEPIGVPGGDTADVGGIYVATVTTPTAGKYWFMAEPVGGRKIQAIGNIVVARKSVAPSVGDRAIPSKTPTLASTDGDLAALTTSRHPDRALYRTSVAQALRGKEPFVVAFATPQYCQTRTCGPVVDVVSAVRKAQPASNDVQFVHVEVYADNDPAKGVNRWVAEWRLPTEPFTYVVDRTGVIRTKLEGAFSAAELERAVDAVR
jgi:hypothetical protein